MFTLLLYNDIFFQVIAENAQMVVYSDRHEHAFGVTDS